MLETTAHFFRQHFHEEVARCIENHEVLRVTRRQGENVIVISETDWQAIAETVFLNQIPGFVQSLQEAAKEPLAEGTPLEQLTW